MTSPSAWRPLLKGDLRDQALASVQDIAGALRNPWFPPRIETDPPDLPGPFGLLTGAAGIAVFFGYLAKAGLRDEAEELARGFLDEAEAGLASIPWHFGSRVGRPSVPSRRPGWCLAGHRRPGDARRGGHMVPTCPRFPPPGTGDRRIRSDRMALAVRAPRGGRSWVLTGAAGISLALLGRPPRSSRPGTGFSCWTTGCLVSRAPEPNQVSGLDPDRDIRE